MVIFKAISHAIRGSLRAKVTLGVTIPLVLVLGIYNTLEYKRHQEVTLIKLSSLAAQSGRVVDSSLRDAMSTSNFSELQSLLDTIDASGEFRLINVLDTNGKVIFAPKSQGVGSQLNNQRPDCMPCHQMAPNERPTSMIIVASDGQRVFRSIYPIQNAPECSTCHNPDQQLIGLLLVDIPVAPVEARLASSLREGMLWWIGAILVTAIIVNLATSRVIIHPLMELIDALSNFSQERLGLRLPVGDLDEVGLLKQAYNAMGQRIESETSENLSLSNRLIRQNMQRGELLKHLITVQEDERKRVSRELHDDLGQSLGALSLQIQALERLITVDKESALKQLSQIQDLINETMEQMYNLILALRPSALDDLGLDAALRIHAERSLNGCGIQFELHTDGISGRLPPDIEIALYRVFQEALNNVRRHSGAKQVCITLAQHDGFIVSEIQDDGKGFDLPSVQFREHGPRGLGLLGIQERVSQYGGQLEIISKPGNGTRLRVIFPISEVDCG
jgi:signal transduction histidine kinase